MTSDSSPLMLSLLAALQALSVIGIAAVTRLAFQINGDLRDIKATLDHPDNGVTARAKQVADRVHTLNNQTLTNSGKIEALERRVDEVEDRIDTLEERG